MKACMRADLYRLYNSKARVVWSVIVILLSLGALCATKSVFVNNFGYSEPGAILTTGVAFFAIILPIFIGFFEISQVYGLDFEAKTMQVMVGIGKKRIDIVLAKQFESYVCLLTDVLCCYAGILIFCLLNKIAVTENYSLAIISALVSAWFSSMVYLTAASTLAYIRFGVGLATVIYVCFSIGLNGLFQIIGNAVGLPKTLIDSVCMYTVSQQSSILTARIQAKSLLLSNIAFYLITIIVWNAVVYLIFRKKELDL